MNCESMKGLQSFLKIIGGQYTKKGRGTMKVNEWVKLLENAYINKPMTCPECGGAVVARMFADDNRSGFAILKCSKCNTQQQISRVKFPVGVNTEKL